jgi:hypothetical protein
VIGYKTILEYAVIGREHRHWYRNARVIMGQMAADSGYPVRYVCDIVAIMSPRLSVGRNLTVSRAYLADGTLLSGVLRATQAALKHYRATGEIRGPKTSRFAEALAGSDNVCVVDTHIATAFGYRPMDARLVSTQRKIERIMGRVSRTCGWGLSDTQAAVWSGYYQTAYPTGNVPVMADNYVPF